MRRALLSKLKEALVSVLPVSVIVLLIACTPLVSLSGKELLAFSLSSLFLILGIGLFNLGADMAMTPMGQHMGEGLTKSKRVWVLLSVCFVMGVLGFEIGRHASKRFKTKIPEIIAGIILIAIGVKMFV